MGIPARDGILPVRETFVKQCLDLTRNVMTTSEEYEAADSAPDADALELIAALQPKQIRAIDAAVMHAADRDWRKLALVVGTVMGMLSEQVPALPDVFYARRVAALVSRGSLSRMRYGEVRIPGQAGGA
jgi:hypothetical protein